MTSQNKIAAEMLLTTNRVVPRCGVEIGPVTVDQGSSRMRSDQVNNKCVWQVKATTLEAKCDVQQLGASRRATDTLMLRLTHTPPSSIQRKIQERLNTSLQSADSEQILGRLLKADTPDGQRRALEDMLEYVMADSFDTAVAAESRKAFLPMLLVSMVAVLSLIAVAPFFSLQQTSHDGPVSVPNKKETPEDEPESGQPREPAPLPQLEWQDWTEAFGVRNENELRPYLDKLLGEAEAIALLEKSDWPSRLKDMFGSEALKLSPIEVPDGEEDSRGGGRKPHAGC